MIASYQRATRQLMKQLAKNVVFCEEQAMAAAGSHLPPSELQPGLSAGIVLLRYGGQELYFTEMHIDVFRIVHEHVELGIRTVSPVGRLVFVANPSWIPSTPSSPSGNMIIPISSHPTSLSAPGMIAPIHFVITISCCFGKIIALLSALFPLTTIPNRSLLEIPEPHTFSRPSHLGSALHARANFALAHAQL